MAEHPIQNLMNVTMDKIRQMVDSNTIVGKPITTDDGTTILPVSKVSFGFASAGTDFDGKNTANKDLFGGGSGAGVNIQPVAFLVVKDGCVRTIQLSDGQQHRGPRPDHDPRTGGEGQRTHKQDELLPKAAVTDGGSFPRSEYGCGSQHCSCACTHKRGAAQQQLPASATGGGRCRCRPFHRRPTACAAGPTQRTLLRNCRRLQHTAQLQESTCSFSAHAPRALLSAGRRTRS